VQKALRHYLLILLKGMGMGAADVVPGVSGGTIAFITGIYEELIHSIKSIDASAVRFFFSGRWKSFWNHINGTFLVSVFAGIAISVVSLARLLEYLLHEHPVMVWSFFFGLILVSSYIVAKRIQRWDYSRIVAIITGIGVAFYITSITPAQTTDASWFVFLAGVLASCAMILPGISGSFILLLLGKYQFALTAVNELRILDLLTLGVGAVVGLLSLSRLLSWLFKKFHDGTVAVLAGFMIGSLNKIWPWKEILETIVVDGEAKPLIEKNILPQFSNPDHQVLPALGMMLVAILLILGMEFLAARKENRTS
jgi:putative membrane protein